MGQDGQQSRGGRVGGAARCLARRQAAILRLRLRIAELREKAGAWRAVFAMLRGARADFPDRRRRSTAGCKEAFAAVRAIPSLDKMAPTELIALLDENAELMADGPDGEPMRALLAQKLMALDLPKQADPLLTKLMRAAPFGPARAGFGATLATRPPARRRCATAPLLALSESNSADMDDAVRERRALITARVEAKRGNAGEAAAALSGNQTPEAEEARAAILEHAQDWPAARDALATLAARVVPDSRDARTTRSCRLCCRLGHCRDARRATTMRLWPHCATNWARRIGSGPQADMFRLLTAAPVRGTADLARARAEMGVARAVAADMGPKKTAAKTP